MYNTEIHNTINLQVKESVQVSSIRQCHKSEEKFCTNLSQEVVSSLKIASGENFPGKDIRPRLKDGYGNSYLLDSGSMCSVWPAGPGDKVDDNVILEAVDGKKFDCYGKKEIEIKIGRKNYRIEAVIAKVKAPLLGWDFNRKYRLDLIWGDFGDLYTYSYPEKTVHIT